MTDSARTANSPSITPTGELRDKYRVLALLGQGGMSLVHIASAQSPGGVQKLVVLKSIRPELMRSEKVRGMFMDEARLATRLSHPNVVQTYEVVLLSGRPVLVMEYMEGQSMFSFLRKAKERGGVTLAMYLHVLQEALLGLDYAHNLMDYDGNSLRLVHRDISPQNVFITYDGHAKILDFGIAKALNNSTQTESGELKGKIRYMSPEQMRGAAELDGRADVFSAGVMLWEALAERRIWIDTSDVDVIDAVLNAGVPRVSTVNPNVNPLLEAICMKALALPPEDRWESAGAMQLAIEEACESLGLRASTKDVSRLMKDLFGEQRAKLRASIDGRMKSSKGRLLDLSEGSDEGPFSDGAFSQDLLSAQPDGTPPLLSETRAAVLPSRRRPLLIGVVLALLGAAAIALVWRYSSGEAKTTTSPAESASVARAAGVASAVAKVAVSFAVSPVQAALFLDGQALPGNPYRAQLTKDSRPHELRAEAPGYAAQSLSISLESPSNLELVLVKAVPLENGAPHKATKRGAVSAPPTSAPARSKAADAQAAKTAHCDPPYTIDEKGIRRMRPECL